MKTYNISVNEKKCAKALKSANSSMDKIKKYMGTTGTNKSSSTIIGCVEKLNAGFKDTPPVADLYDNFNKSLAELQSRLNQIDAGFQVIDKVV